MISRGKWNSPSGFQGCEARFPSLTAKIEGDVSFSHKNHVKNYFSQKSIFFAHIKLSLIILYEF